MLLGLIPLFNDLETVIQVAEETEISACRVHNVTRNELDIFIEHLKLISQQANIVIYAEIEKHDDVISSLTFSPRGSKGKKISLHYGEVYLLARAISHPDTIPFASLIPSTLQARSTLPSVAILCDDESGDIIDKWILSRLQYRNRNEEFRSKIPCKRSSKICKESTYSSSRDYS